MFCVLSSPEQFDELIRTQADFFLYKYNSKSCRISQRTMQEVRNAIQELHLQSVYFVDVIHHKPLSQYIAEKTNIRHESPQLFIFQQGVAKDSTSHMRISQKWITQNI